MAAEAQHATRSREQETVAPRFPAPPGSMAALNEQLASYHAKVAEEHAAVGTLTSWQMSDIFAFGTSAEDMHQVVADQAYALSSVLSTALVNAEDDQGSRSRDVHLASAIDAIGTLIALSNLAARAAIAKAEGRV